MGDIIDFNKAKDKRELDDVDDAVESISGAIGDLVYDLYGLDEETDIMSLVATLPIDDTAGSICILFTDETDKSLINDKLKNQALRVINQMFQVIANLDDNDKV